MTVPPSNGASRGPGGKVGRATFAQAARDRGAGVRGLAAEPACGALDQPAPAQLGADPAGRRAQRDIRVVLDDHPARVQRRRVSWRASRVIRGRSTPVPRAGPDAARAARRGPTSRRHTGAPPARPRPTRAAPSGTQPTATSRPSGIRRSSRRPCSGSDGQALARALERVQDPVHVIGMGRVVPCPKGRRRRLDPCH